ncbi:MAG: hypothetical protein ABSF50_17435 [Burkholderiaceae bacterium]
MTASRTLIAKIALGFLVLAFCSEAAFAAPPHRHHHHHHHHHHKH